MLMTITQNPDRTVRTKLEARIAKNIGQTLKASSNIEHEIDVSNLQIMKHGSAVAIVLRRHRLSSL